MKIDKPNKQPIFIGNINNPKYNSFGHASQELRKVDSNNHFIVLGDEGGLPEDIPIAKSFPHLTSKILQMDYYNLCVIGGGIEAIKHNLFVWLHKIGKPKAIVIACKNPNTFLRYDYTQTFFQPAHVTLRENNYKALYRCASKEFKFEKGWGGYFGSRNFIFLNLIKHCIKIPIVELVWEENTKRLTEATMFLHYANDDHEELSKNLSDAIKESIRIYK